MPDQPASKVLLMFMERIVAEHQAAVEREVEHVLEVEREERGYPEGARFDAARQVWVMPDPESEEHG